MSKLATALNDELIALRKENAELKKQFIIENDRLKQQFKEAENDKWNYKATIVKFQQENKQLMNENDRFKNTIADYDYLFCIMKEYLEKIEKHPTCSNAITGIVETFRQKLEEL